MKTITIALFLFASIPFCAQSQGFRLNAYGNYVFDDRVDSYYSATSYFNGTVQGGFLWGGGLEFRLRDNYGLELMYLRQDTKAPTTYYDYNSNDVKNATLDLGVNWIMVGGTRSMHANDKVEPYGGLLLGAAIIDVKNPDTKSNSSLSKFAWGLRLGVNIWATEAVGLKLQAQLQSAVQGAGGGLYFGTGGAGAGVSTYSSILQFVLGGGLTFNIGQHSGKK